MVTRNHAQSQLPYQKWPIFSNFQVQRDCPSATKYPYLLYLNRRYIIHFQYSVSGFGAKEVARMTFFIVGGPIEALSSLIQSLLKALVRSNLPLRRS